MIIECTPMRCTVTIGETDENGTTPTFKGELKAYGVITIIKPDGDYLLQNVSFVLHLENRTILPYYSHNVKID